MALPGLLRSLDRHPATERLPEICQKPRYAQPSRHSTTQPSAAPLNCAVAWERKELRGFVNYPHIDGKDGIVARTESLRQAALLQRI